MQEVVTQIFTLDRLYLGAYIGKLSRERLARIRLGIHLVLGDEDAVDRLL